MEYNHGVNPIRPRKWAAINIEAEPSEINSIQQYTTITPASQLTSNTPVNAITQEDLMKQMQIFREEMAETNKRFLGNEKRN
eukprot:10703909-Ditylum_brightwellii.AAC.1